MVKIELFQNQSVYLIFIIALLFLLVIVTRFLPFWMESFFERSVLLRNIGALLPGTIMLLLALNLFKTVSFLTYPYGVPELVSVGIAVGLFLWKRNLLFAFLPSTLIYLVIVNALI